MQQTTDKTPKRALGRGLSALIPQAAKTEVVRPGGVSRLPIDLIARDEAQPRKSFDDTKLKELAESIRVQGILQPILVRRDGERYRLIAGERRWRAAQLAGLDQIPALVKDVGEGQAFELALVENLQRADLNPLEEAEGYQRLIEEFGFTQDKVSERVGKDRSSVANALRLLALPDEVKGLLAEGAVSMGHARALLGLPKALEIVALAKRVVAEKLSVRETERLVKLRRSPPPAAESPAAPKPNEASPAARAVVEELQRSLGTKVRLVTRGTQGTIEIDFFSFQDLDRLVQLLRK